MKWWTLLINKLFDTGKLWDSRVSGQIGSTSKLSYLNLTPRVFCQASVTSANYVY